MGDLDETLSRAIERAGLPGAVALIGDRDGLVYAKACGERGVADAAPMTLDTLFWFASMTKAVTSVAAMQLVEQGRLALDEPMGRLLPGLAMPRVLDGFKADGTPRFRPAKREITLRHLLTHTAGFGYDFMNADMLRAWGPGGPPTAMSLASLDAPLLFDPGARWEYGIATDWVGRAVEAASGQGLDAYFAEHVFGPLGMTDTGFVVPPDKRARVAPMHIRGAGGALTPVPSPAEGLSPGEFFSGGGGLTGTGGDYMRFLRTILNGGVLDGVRILKFETVAAMTVNQIGDLRAGALSTTAPHLCAGFDLYPKMRTGWGLGFLINPEASPGGGRAAGSLAWAGLANTHYWIDPASGRAGLFLAQMFPFGDAKVMDAVRAFEKAAYAD